VYQIASGNWGLPKGAQERGETIETCAKRELKEETGIDISHIPLANMKVITISQHTYYVIIVDKEPTAEVGDDGEIKECKYVSIEEFKSMKRSAYSKRIIPRLEEILEGMRQGSHAASCLPPQGVNEGRSTETAK